MSSQRLIVGVLAAFLLVGGSASAAVRYAGPSGSGTNCTNGSPCSFTTAVESAASGDEVIVQSGSYSVSGTVDASTLLSLDLHGAPGPVRPIVSITAPMNNSSLRPGSLAHVHDLDLVFPGSQVTGLFTGSGLTLENVSISAPGVGDTAVWVNASGSIQSTIRNVMLRAGDTALTTSDANVVIRNVTGIATGPDSYGLAANALGGAARTVDVRSSIFEAAGYDVYVQGSDQTVDADYSEYTDFTLQANGVLSAGAHNVHVPPTTVSPTDLHVTAASAGNDAGTTDFFTPSTDIDGDARPLGAFPDIGADEFRSPQFATTAPATGATDTGATLNGTIDRRYESVQWQFEYGPTTAYGHVTQIAPASGTGPQPVSAPVSGLDPETSYHYRLVTVSGYNQIVTGLDQTFTTTATPVPPAATPPAGQDPPITPPGPGPSLPVNENPGTPGGPAGVPGCSVPRLKGLTAATARKRLARAHCRLGKVRGHGRVRRQSRRAGARLPARTKVGLTLRPRHR